MTQLVPQLFVAERIETHSSSSGSPRALRSHVEEPLHPLQVASCDHGGVDVIDVEADFTR